jgi:hypothetical protein
MPTRMKSKRKKRQVVRIIRCSSKLSPMLKRKTGLALNSNKIA